MHKWVYEKTEKLKSEIESIGCDNLTHEQMEEAYYISKILKNIVCIDKEYHIVDAMEEAENEDNMEMIERYTDYPTRHYRMTPEMYRDNSAEHMRDMDRKHGIMYYTEPKHEGRMDRAIRMFNETKELHPTNSAEDKQQRMSKINETMDEFSESIKELMLNASPEERTMWKRKGMNLFEAM